MINQYAPVVDATDPQVDALIQLFDSTFYAQYNVRLVRGAHEPIYLPACDSVDYHRIVFANGYFSSALHEIAHWCIAGNERRKLEDYGYWYHADGRNEQQQHAFEQVEVKPQAIEWAFTFAAGRQFQVSTDNLGGAEPNRNAFAHAVYKQLLDYVENGFPERAAKFLGVLSDFFEGKQLDEKNLSEVRP